MSQASHTSLSKSEKSQPQRERSASPAAAPLVSFDEKKIAQQKQEGHERKSALRPAEAEKGIPEAGPNKGKPVGGTRKEKRAQFWKARRNRRGKGPHPENQAPQRSFPREASPARVVELK